MRELVLICVTGILCATGGFGQDKTADSGALNQQIAVLYQQGKFDDAINLAEKVVNNEKRAAKNSETHALALANLAFLYKEKAKLLKTGNPAKGVRERIQAADDAKAAANKAKELFREALDIHKAKNLEESAAAASAKSELAWLVYNFIVSTNIAESREQIDEAEKLYLESIATQDRLAAVPTNVMLRTILDFGQFYMRYVNFEKAIPLFERYLSAVEGKYGPKSTELVPALRSFTDIYSNTNRDSEAKATADRVSEITGKPENVELKYPGLTMRSRGIARVNVQGFLPMDFSDAQANFILQRAAVKAVLPAGQKIMKSLKVNILVSENGEVTEAKAATKSKYEKEIEEAARASRFRPFVYLGVAQKLRGSITFSYYEF